MAVVHMEQQCRRGQPWRRWKNSDDSPLPRLDWTDGEVEKVEKATAKLRTSWPTRFCGGEHARRRRRTVSNGGAAALLLRSHGRAEEREMGLVSWLIGALGELKQSAIADRASPSSCALATVKTRCPARL